MTTTFASVNDVYSWIGRSLYSGDPYPDFTLDEFRIYNGALSAAEITASDALGADQLLNHARPLFSAPSVAGGNLILSWPLASAGFTLMMRTNLTTGSWIPVVTPAPQISGGQWQVAFPLNSAAQYFQLVK